MCSSCNLTVVPSSKAGGFLYQIPLQEFKAPNSRCKFKVWFCMSSDKVNKVLATVKVKPGEAPLKVNDMAAMERLADYHDNGNDMAYYGVDLNALLSTIIFTPEEQNKPACDIACTY